MEKIVYAIYYVGSVCDTPIGYATGDAADIIAYYTTNGCVVDVRPIKIVDVPAGTANEKAKLLGEQFELESKLKEVNNKIKQITRG